MYSHGRLCVYVCVSVPLRMPTLMHGPIDVTLENGRGAP